MNISDYETALTDVSQADLLQAAYNSLAGLDGLSEAEAAKRRQSPRMRQIVAAITAGRLRDEAERLAIQLRDIWIGDLQDRLERRYSDRLGKRVWLLVEMLRKIDLHYYRTAIMSDCLDPDEANTTAANILAVLRWYKLLYSGKADHLFDLPILACEAFIKQAGQPIQPALWAEAKLDKPAKPTRLAKPKSKALDLQPTLFP